MFLYDEKRRLFHIRTMNSSYIFEIGADEQPHHLYWGAALETVPAFMYDRAPYRRAASVENVNADSPKCSREYFHYECPTYGMGDFRIPAVHGKFADGTQTIDLRFAGYEISDDCAPVKGMPGVHGEGCSVLTVRLADALKGLEVRMCFRIFEDSDVITRSVSVINNGDEPFELTQIMSTCVDFENGSFDLMTFGGTTLREFTREVRTLAPGITEVNSMRGISSHQHHPSAVLMEKNTDENSGAAYGFTLIYSGNFTLRAEIDPFGSCRLQTGINPFGFAWKLETGERFDSPEASMVWTDRGLNDLSGKLHDFMRNHILPVKWAKQPRPVLLNTWEGCYFDVNAQKLKEMGSKAGELGIKLLVLDDGWFGRRNAADSSLGDWNVNTEKFPGGLDALADDMPVSLGIWFEPEMISPDSDLYRAHPDWCLHIDGRVRTEWRNQLVLDMSRADVVDYIAGSMDKILDSGKVKFIKWDHNRRLTQVFSALLPADRQSEVFHRYMLGVYRLLEHVRSRHPGILMENCASGGGRYDWGMYCYFDQGWLSDNTDAVCRLELQSAASVFFPPEVITSHISASPNQQVNRETPWNFRRDVCALFNAGFELDISLSDPLEVKEAAKLFEEMGRERAVSRFYRLNPDISDRSEYAWELVSRERVLIAYFRPYCIPEPSYWKIMPKGLDDGRMYTDTRTGETLKGSIWMNTGVYPTWRNGDCFSEIIVLEAK